MYIKLRGLLFYPMFKYCS